jgi:Ca2+-binding RTX toxin-like protein
MQIITSIKQKRLMLGLIGVVFVTLSFVVSAAVIRYVTNVEGTVGNDLIRPDEEEDISEETITIRGDGNGIFEDGEDSCDSQNSNKCGNDKILGSNNIWGDIIFGDDGLGGVAGTGHDWIIGGLNNDSIYGESGNDRIYGEKGDDQINGGDGDDRLEGSPGMDLLEGGAGRDTLLGGPDDDVIDGGPDNDKIEGGDGNDRLDGDLGNDILRGGAGDDEIDGGPGNDFIEGGPGTDLLLGGGGNDTFLLRAGDVDEGAVEVIYCTVEATETGKVLLRGKFKEPFGKFRDTVVRVQDPVTGGIYEIVTGPGECLIRRG